MSDDIVTRLREHANGDFEKTSEFMLGLAADEIERLREELEASRSAVSGFIQMLGQIGKNE